VRLAPGAEQIIVTGVPHEVVPHEGARFFVAFYGPPQADAAR
jgi:hypothetical protein